MVDSNSTPEPIEGASTLGKDHPLWESSTLKNCSTCFGEAGMEMVMLALYRDSWLER